MKRDNRSLGTKAAQYVIAKIISGVLASLRLVPYKQRVALGGAFFQYVVSPVSKNKERILENVDHVVPELDLAARARLIAGVPNNIGRTLTELFFPDGFFFPVNLSSDAFSDSDARALTRPLVASLVAKPEPHTQATSLSVRDRLIESWNDTQQYFREQDPKRVYYLSMEFLMGRSLTNSLYNLEVKGTFSEGLRQLGYSLEDLVEKERDAALGNGGLGRLAAPFRQGRGHLLRPDLGASQIDQGVRSGCCLVLARPHAGWRL